MGRPLDREIARNKFHQQRRKAKARGIDWELTFDQWLAWWGEDIDRRGPGFDQLQMQRPADSGPYALWNIRKGVARQNAKTRGDVVRTKRTLIKAETLERTRDALPAKVEPPPDDLTEDEAWLLYKMGGRRQRWGPRY